MRKVRNREMRNEIELILLRLVPWLFIILLYLTATSLGTAAAAGGPIQTILD